MTLEDSCLARIIRGANQATYRKTRKYYIQKACALRNEGSVSEEDGIPNHLLYQAIFKTFRREIWLKQVLSD